MGGVKLGKESYLRYPQHYENFDQLHMATDVKLN